MQKLASNFVYSSKVFAQKIRQIEERQQKSLSPFHFVEFFQSLETHHDIVKIHWKPLVFKSINTQYSLNTGIIRLVEFHFQSGRCQPD